MSEQAPSIFPSMRFADPDTALDWLARAFGFSVDAVQRDDEGVVRHAEMSLGNGAIMFGQGDPATTGVYVAVADADADAHYARAMAAGAEITRELCDTPYGSREYGARDPEGHAWTFGTYQPDRGS
jgi:uncharacterized glyoxalase superfamily protein PhnB